MPRTPEAKFVKAVRDGVRAGKTQDQIGASLGITGSAVSQRCGRLRSQGIRLPLFASGRFDASRQIDRIGFRHPRGHLTIVEQKGKKSFAVCDCGGVGPLEYFTRNIVTGSTIRCVHCRPKPMTAAQLRVKQREWGKKWADKNPDKVAAKQRKFKENNPGYHRTWYSRNAARAVKAVSAYNKRNRPKINAYTRKKRREDPRFRMAQVLRGRIRSAVKRFLKDGHVTGISAVRHLGCSLSSFVKHLESKFTSGMSWQNHGNGRGKWNVEHIYPISAADLSDPIQVRAVFNWRNQIPMWDSENKSKKDRITAEAKSLFERLLRQAEATMAQERA
jgi:hypothetical protein